MPTQYQEEHRINERTYIITRLPFGQPGSPGGSHVLGILSRELNATIFRVLQGAPGEIPILELIAAAIGMFEKFDSREFRKALDIMGSFTTAIAPDQQKQVQLDSKMQANWWSWYPEDFFPWLQAAIKVNLFDFLGGTRNTYIGEKIMLALEKLKESKNAQESIWSFLGNSGSQNTPTQAGGFRQSGGPGTSWPTDTEPSPISASDGTQ
jgi:hypothetical protein